jgi:vacuolar protein sorting-associated protein 35
VTALQSIVGTLHRCHSLSPDNRDALSQSAVSYAAKLLKRADQCRAAVATSHIWWQDDPAPPPRSPAAAAAAQPPVRDAPKVMAGLKRALKAVGAAKQQRAAAGLAPRPGAGGKAGGGGGGGASAAAAAGAGAYLGLYVDIANQYLYYFERGVPEMSPSVVSQVRRSAGRQACRAQRAPRGVRARGRGRATPGRDALPRRTRRTPPNLLPALKNLPRPRPPSPASPAAGARGV